MVVTWSFGVLALIFGTAAGMWWLLPFIATAMAASAAIDRQQRKLGGRRVY